MSSSVAGGNGRPFRGGPLIPILFFITPLFTAASARLAPFLHPIAAVLRMIAALRRGLPWRDLFRPNAALIAHFVPPASSPSSSSRTGRRATMNTFPSFRPERSKHVTIHHDRVTKINLSEFNQNFAILALLLWPGLLALSAAKSPRVLLFLALAVPDGISEHDSSQVGLISSLLVLLLAWMSPRAVARGLSLLS